MGRIVGGAGVDGDAGVFESFDDGSVDDRNVDHLDGVGAEGAGGGDIVGEPLAGIEKNEGHPRGQFAHGVEGAVVEALEDDLGDDLVAEQLLVDSGGEPVGVDGRVDFGFDHETGAAFLGEGEDFGEGRDAFAGDEFLPGEVRAGGGTAVEGADFGEGEAADGMAAEFEVVVNNEVVIFGDDDVELQDVGAHGEGVFEGGDSVFRAEGATAAVAEDEGVGDKGEGGEEKQAEAHGGSLHWGLESCIVSGSFGESA